MKSILPSRVFHGPFIDLVVELEACKVADKGGLQSPWKSAVAFGTS